MLLCHRSGNLVYESFLAAAEVLWFVTVCSIHPYSVTQLATPLDNEMRMKEWQYVANGA